jgi:adenylate kinase
MKVIVTAVPGAGKSTTMQLARRMDPDIRIVNFGDYMFEVANREYGIEDRDLMRENLSPQEYREVQKLAAEELAKLEGDVLIDTHTSIKMVTGYYPGLPDHLISLLEPDCILILEFDPKAVLERRMKDVGIKEEEATQVGTIRKPRARRDEEALHEVELQQEMNRYFAVAAANAARSSVKVINLRYTEERPFEHAEVGAAEILKVLGKKALSNPF